jgi:hypothetical protein
LVIFSDVFSPSELPPDCLAQAIIGRYGVNWRGVQTPIATLKGTSNNCPRSLGFPIGELELELELELEMEMKLANALAPEHHRQLSDSLTRMVDCRAVEELLDLCGWQIAQQR